MLVEGLLLEEESLEFLVLVGGDGGSAVNLELVYLILGEVVVVLVDDLGGGQEEIEGHGTVLVVHGVSELLAFLDHGVDDGDGDSGGLNLALLLLLLLVNKHHSEALKLLVVLKVVVFVGLTEFSEVHAEGDAEHVGNLAHLDLVDLLHVLLVLVGLERLEGTEHLDLLGVLELGGFHHLFEGLDNFLVVEGGSNRNVLSHDLLSLGLVLHPQLVGVLVVFVRHLDVLACLLGASGEAELVVHHTLLEDRDVLLVVLGLEGSDFLDLKLLLFGSKGASSLSEDDGSEHKEIGELEATVGSGGEFTMGVHGILNGDHRVLILGRCVGGFLASPKITQHDIVIRLF